VKLNNKILIIGGNRINEKNPLNTIFNVLKKQNLNFEFITSSIHLNKPYRKKSKFKDYLKSKSIKYKLINSYGQLYFYLEKISKKFNIIILLSHSTFIFKNDIIKLVKKRIFNYHLGSLPEQRGGAPGSWQTLMSKKSTKMTIHKVTDKIDRGNIVLTKLININKDQTLKKFYSNVRIFEYNFFKNFFKKLNKKKIEKKQNEKKSIYMPRLSTKAHGYINWSWSGEEIYNFIRSFDFPFGGARTYLNGKEVIIGKVKLIKKRFKFHPFQSGIIFRKEKDFYLIACKGYSIKTNYIKNSKGKIVKDRLLGKRLYTPYSVLDKSMTSVSIQSPSKDLIQKKF